MPHYDFEVRISYAETDRMGVIYYANYLVFFERGRTEYLRAHGLRYRDMEENDGIFLPAMDSHVTYLHPGRYDDLIRVRTFVSEVGGASVVFRYEITQVESGQLIATGSTKHAIVNRQWHPTRMPDRLRSFFKKELNPKTN